MKIAKLVYVNLLVRVIVDADADEQTIMETAIPKLSEQLMDNPLENIEKIVYDLEMPYTLEEDYYHLLMQEVDVADAPDELWNSDFSGVVMYVKTDTDNSIYVGVEDSDGYVWGVDVKYLTK